MAGAGANGLIAGQGGVTLALGNAIKIFIFLLVLCTIGSSFAAAQEPGLENPPIPKEDSNSLELPELPDDPLLREENGKIVVLPNESQDNTVTTTLGVVQEKNEFPVRNLLIGVLVLGLIVYIFWMMRRKKPESEET